MIEMKFTFGDSRKFANVDIFEALKKELDARVMEISVMMSSKKKTQPFSFLRPVFIPDGFKVSDVKFVLTTLTSLAEKRPI